MFAIAFVHWSRNFLNVLIFGFASYRGVSYMDSTTFCGQTCHTVMQPEFSAYQNSPHSRVECVQCHIGPGAGWFVKSNCRVCAKFTRLPSKRIPARFLLRSSTYVLHEIPVSSAIGRNVSLAISSSMRTNYKEDEKNTPLTTALIVKIGGHTRDEFYRYSWPPSRRGSRIHYISIDDAGR